MGWRNQLAPAPFLPRADRQGQVQLEKILFPAPRRSYGEGSPSDQLQKMILSADLSPSARPSECGMYRQRDLVELCTRHLTTRTLFVDTAEHARFKVLTSCCQLALSGWLLHGRLHKSAALLVITCAQVTVTANDNSPELIAAVKRGPFACADEN